MGLGDQIAESSPHISATAQSLRPLMSPRRAITCTHDHDEALKREKGALLSPLLLTNFDPALPIILQMDASFLHGTGYSLLQEHDGGQLWLVQCEYTLLRHATYATASKCKFYFIGIQTFEFVTDHCPLIPILNHYTLDTI